MTIFFFVVALCGLLLPSTLAYAKYDPAEEIKVGKEESERYASDKTTKFIDDAAMNARIQTIVEAIAKVANVKKIEAKYGRSDVAKFDYTFKIVDEKDINAFSLPGGYLYVNKGLIDYAQSDDELAGVMAHEIAHISHHHAMQLLAEQQKQMLGVMGAVVGAALGGVKGGDLGTLAYMGNLVTIAKMSSYGQKAEFDADRTAVAYLADTKYNPVGMLTFMERLARDEIRKPGINYGIFATHPPSHLRANEIIDEIQKRGLTINRRLVTTYMRVQVKPVENSSASSVWVADTEIVRLADSGGKPSAARADVVAGVLRDALLAGAKLRDVKISTDQRSVTMMGKPVVTPAPEDAALAGQTVPQVVSDTAEHIKLALMRELLQGGY